MPDHMQRRGFLCHIPIRVSQTYRAKQGLCVVVITHDGEFLRESGAQTAEWVPKGQLQ